MLTNSILIEKMDGAPIKTSKDDMISNNQLERGKWGVWDEVFKILVLIMKFYTILDLLPPYQKFVKFCQ